MCPAGKNKNNDEQAHGESNSLESFITEHYAQQKVDNKPHQKRLNFCNCICIICIRDTKYGETDFDHIGLIFI